MYVINDIFQPVLRHETPCTIILVIDIEVPKNTVDCMKGKRITKEVTFGKSYYWHSLKQGVRGCIIQ